MSSNLLANARAIWAQNSTAIPVAITRLTNETAFNEMSHTTMIPIRFKIINDIVNATQNPAASPFLWIYNRYFHFLYCTDTNGLPGFESIPNMSMVMAVTARIQILRLNTASLTIVKYCS